ncbi:MAG: hypothetical protein WAZ94_09160 [Phycisphaerales bacterium]
MAACATSNALPRAMALTADCRGAPSIYTTITSAVSTAAPAAIHASRRPFDEALPIVAPCA